MIIAFEGLDGAGKETQSKWLADSLHQEGHKVFLYHFPAYKGPFYEIYTKITGMDIPIDSKNRLIQHLFTEDMNRVMAKTKEHKDAILILDRYKYSTMAYGESLGVVREAIYTYIEGLPHADVIFYLRLEPANARVTGHFAYEVQHGAAEIYDNLALNSRPELGNKWITIDATDHMLNISHKCIQETNKRLPAKT